MHGLKRNRTLRKRLLAGLIFSMISLIVFVNRRQYELDHSLAEAIRKGNTDLVAGLLAQGARPDVVMPQDETRPSPAGVAKLWWEMTHLFQHPYGPSALEVAATKHNAKCVHLLLKAGALDDPSGPVAKASLFAAVSETVKGTRSFTNNHVESVPNVDVVRELVNYGVPPNISSAQGYTPLMLGVLSGNDEIVECLLSHGATVQQKNSEGESALDIASRFVWHCAYSGLPREKPNESENRRIRIIQLLEEQTALGEKKVLQ